MKHKKRIEEIEEKLGVNKPYPYVYIYYNNKLVSHTDGTPSEGQIIDNVYITGVKPNEHRASN